MTTAITDVVKEDRTTPADPFDMGAGRIDLGNVDGAPLTFDETAANYAALGNDPLNAGRPEPAVDQRAGHAGQADDHPHGDERHRQTQTLTRHRRRRRPARTITVPPSAFTLMPGAVAGR